jgi:hypothetical protein
VWVLTCDKREHHGARRRERESGRVGGLESEREHENERERVDLKSIDDSLKKHR